MHRHIMIESLKKERLSYGNDFADVIIINLLIVGTETKLSFGEGYPWVRDPDPRQGSKNNTGSIFFLKVSLNLSNAPTRTVMSGQRW